MTNQETVIVEVVSGLASKKMTPIAAAKRLEEHFNGDLLAQILQGVLQGQSLTELLQMANSKTASKTASKAKPKTSKTARKTASKTASKAKPKAKPDTPLQSFKDALEKFYPDSTPLEDRTGINEYALTNRISILFYTNSENPEKPWKIKYRENREYYPIGHLYDMASLGLGLERLEDLAS